MSKIKRPLRVRLRKHVTAEQAGWLALRLGARIVYENWRLYLVR